jgi:hypothetical protein
MTIIKKNQNESINKSLKKRVIFLKPKGNIIIKLCLKKIKILMSSWTQVN